MNNSLQKLFVFIAVFLATIVDTKGQFFTLDNLSLTATSGLTVSISGDFRNQNNGTIDNAGTIRVSGNWTNNAVNNVFNTNSGTVEMNGSSVQTISGTNSTYFYNLTLNNTNASATRYALGIDQTVKNNLTLSAGQVFLADNIMTIGTSSASPGILTYNAGWLYGGTLKRWFGTSTIANSSPAGLFPMGSASDYRPVYISAPTAGPATGGTINILHNDVAGNIPISFVDIDVTIDRVCNPNWVVSTGNGLAGGTYNLRGDGTGFTGITDYTMLRLIQVNSAVGINSSNAGSNANPQVNRTELALAQLTNSFHFGYPAAAALPIELLSFDANAVGLIVEVDWVTASEINTDYFTIERSSDGRTYEAITTVMAAGNSNINMYYSTVDFNPLPGLSFYRLKETDLDGTINYGLPVSVRFNNNFELEMFATRSSNEQLTVIILSPDDEDFVLYVYDSVGKLISQHSGSLVSGNQKIVLPLINNAKSIYMVSLRTQSRVISKKIF